MSEEIKVSICCMTYNHEKFIRQALDSFLMQKTNFKYEIIVHDDASTDNTPNILKEYEEKYPEIIKVMYEKENQYCHMAKSLMEVFEKTQGKYIAMCEGDDYWCDEYKIQKQYDLMEENKDCSMCVHNTIIHDLNNIEKDRNFNDWKEVRELTDYDIFFGWKVHTSSYFIRREFAIYPKEFWGYWCGDYVFLTMEYYNGKIMFLPEVMSVYNWNNKQGATYKNNEDAKLQISKENSRKQYLKEYNEFTKGKFENIVNERISEIEFIMLLEEVLHFDLTASEFKERKQKLKQCEYYKKYVGQLTFMKKVKFYVKTNTYIGNRIFKKLKK